MNSTKIRWIGHACFLITSAKGGHIVIDPFDEQLGYSFEDINACAVFVSHDHFDHNAVNRVGGNPKIIKGSEPASSDTAIECKCQPGCDLSVTYRHILTYHDDEEGSIRGKNAVLTFVLDNIRFCHLGDLCHPLSDEQVKAIGSVDILMVPVGGRYTIDGFAAQEATALLNPKIVVPMHYKTDKTNELPIDGPDRFIKGYKNVVLLDRSEYEITHETLPKEITVVQFPTP